MSKLRLAAALFVFGFVASTTAGATDRDHDYDHRDRDHHESLTLAVFGDWPYSTVLLDNAKLLTDSVNSDHDIDFVIHVGDIHSGSMACTSYGVFPPLANSNPGWNQQVYYQFQQFHAPMIYTPGDNEWTDCHKSKELSSGAPLKELESVRSMFFARAGHTLGRQDMRVWSQAKFFDKAHPTDANYVENVIWEKDDVVFTAINVPGGSNNDTAQWSAPFTDDAAQAQEVAERTGADIRWLEAAFDEAHDSHAKVVVIAIQADLWDPEAAAPGGAGLDQYATFVQKLADLSVHFGRPVLLLNGDTHLYFADKPLADPTSSTGVIYKTQPVPNLTRIVVQGSTNIPGEWLKLKIELHKAQPFSWVNVPYCADPSTAC